MASELEIHRTVRAISIDLDLAVAFYETYVPSGQDAGLIDRVNKSDFYPAFNVISDALHRNVIVTLCRIWDTRTDTANLNSLADEFRDPKVLADLRAIGHQVDPQHLGKWLTEIDMVSKSDELLALKRARHRAIAHTATPNEPYRGKARGAEYGDERKVIEWTIPLVERAGTFIGYSYVSGFDEQRRTRREHAVKFWDQIPA
jgi:AbiU2